ncbi:hypothetical protein [Actinomadura sp. WMMB 499]|uniref:hypothetical protein n=1 Tax=Actinomadura sp. WMMB 499 TaxID=1219491 RepID=UPI001247FAA1|nr:hypothetical protein [Actinomadura sp. WMMB 499]QFG22007.1 hypothetical protein F7P10_13630 [Actinomadura sp. WMMB 499]
MDDHVGAGPAELLHPVVFAPEFDRGPFAHLEGLPDTVEDLARALAPVAVTGERMLPLLVRLCTEDLAYGVPFDPWTPDRARDVLGRVVDALGPETRWWSNVSYPDRAWASGDYSGDFSSSPVTGYTTDCAVVGIGRYATLTMLAFAES